jgi:hypothetical protein
MTARPGVSTALENVTRSSSNRPGFDTVFDEDGANGNMIKTRKPLHMAPGSTANRRRVRRSDRRFLWLSLLVGTGIATALAVGLYFMHQQR